MRFILNTKTLALILIGYLSLPLSGMAYAVDKRFRGFIPMLLVDCADDVQTQVSALDGPISCIGNYINSFDVAYAAPGYLVISTKAYRDYSGSSASAQFFDYFIIDHPTLSGQRGYMTAEVQITAWPGIDAPALEPHGSGRFNMSAKAHIMSSEVYRGGAVKRFYDHLGGSLEHRFVCSSPSNCYFTRVYTITYDDPRYGLDGYNTPLHDGANLVRLTAPFTFGYVQSVDMMLYADAYVYGTYPRSISGFYEIMWKGITEIRDADGEPVTDFNLVSLTGLDYRIAVNRPDIAAIPEPNVWAMLLAGLGLIGLAARRQRTKE